jgi:hypothetical protein
MAASLIELTFGRPSENFDECLFMPAYCLSPIGPSQPTVAIHLF